MNTRSMRPAVLFDLDCTLVDRAHSIRQYAARFAEDFRPQLLPTPVDQLAAVLIAADGWGYRPTERFHDMVATLEWHVPPSPDALAAHWNRHFPSLAVAMDGAIEVLQALQTLGLPLGLITNGTVRVQEQKLAVLGLRPYFHTIVVSEAARVKKPHRAIFQQALDGLGVAATDAWFVGDHPVNDMLGARRAGLQTVWLAGIHAWSVADVRPHYHISTLRELVPLLTSAMAATC